MQMDNDTPLIEVKNLKTWFPVKSGLLQRTSAHVRAVDDVSFSIPKGKTLALVGESGCGKTTVGKTILRLIKATGGEVLYGGQNILALSEKDLLPYRKKLQIIFQDPANSLNPRMLVKDIVGEGLRSFKMVSGKADYEAKVTAVLDKVGLGSDTLHRYPHEFSGGQRQRICIARALAVDPEFIVCDEATSALDVSVQASILNLLKDLQAELGLTYLFITHDLSVVEYLSDRVAVMYLGQLVDEADTNELFTNPKHPYTQALMASAPSLNPDHRELTALGGEVPSPMNPPSGCRFHTRCEKRFEPCDKGVVPFVQVNKGRCRCLLYKD
ncbi:MAG: oligopeptide/dipeptide ABC transporter ATP-binding protein [Kiritimatiellia bacterium]|jgi:oligopeptide/dipeptide ABC transporter ATP-binding protein